GVGRRSTSRVEHVVGLPRTATPRAHPTRQDPTLTRKIHALVTGYGGTCAVYVENLTDGSGAAFNARARFPAASTLNLAIAVPALTGDEVPGPGTRTDSLLRRMIEDSDNDAADDLEIHVAGSTS